MNDLSTAMHEWAGRAATGEQPPVAELIAAGTKRRNRRRAGAAGAATLALAAVVGGALATTGGAGAAGTPAAVAGQSPAVELAAAATSTSETSFKFVVNSTLTLPAWQIDHVKETCTGAIDPLTRSGFVETGSVFSARVVNGHRYVAKENYWQDRGKGDVAGILLCGDPKAPAGADADPATELKVLSKAGTVTKNAAGFSFTGDEIKGAAKVSGGHVVQISYTITSRATKDYPAYTRETTMTLSGFGDKVSVKKPI
ncbi:hypothetical protein [Actinoplanes sp. NPDC051411]|uniref:hypothetical protein n=1 Tax=Actinoplanes sp. NPDC051411 TaxID=3155522 RepID=UPI0034234296